jgi:hypothetical protein
VSREEGKGRHERGGAEGRQHNRLNRVGVSVHDVEHDNKVYLCIC